MTPSRIAFPTMYSASSSESRWSLTQISLRDMREYDRERRRIPVLITFWWSLTMRVYVLSPSSCAACLMRVVWNCDNEPLRTANEKHLEQVYVPRVCQTFHDLEVCAEGFFEHWMPEETSFGDVAHKEFNNDKKFVDSLVKAGGSLCLRCASDGLL